MTTTAAEVSHLWRRAAFGIDAAGAETRAGTPWPDLVEELVAPNAAPMPRPAALDDPALAGSMEFYRGIAVSIGWLDHMAATPTPGAEKLAWFWHNHFTTSMAKVMWGEGLFRQLETIRGKGQGSFRDLLGDVAVDSAMCLYLDNVANVKGRTNENFARELLELFTVGIGNYGQADVLGVARSMTGQNVDWSGSLRPTFYPTLHDSGSKTVLGSTGSFAVAGLCDVLCNATNRQLVARRVASKLWTAWAYPDPSPTLVAEVAQAALDGGFSGRSFARAVLLHPEFRSHRALTTWMRSPLEAGVALAKVVGTAPSSVGVPAALSNAGHFPYLPPNVGGWPSARSLASPSAWWHLGNVIVSAVYRSLTARPSSVPVTAGLAPAEAARTMLRWVGVLDPTEATVTALSDYVSLLRTWTPGSEPMSLALAAALSPEFMAGGTGPAPTGTEV